MTTTEVTRFPARASGGTINGVHLESIEDEIRSYELDNT